MEITLSRLLTAEPILSRLLQNEYDADVAFWLRRQVKKLGPVFEEYQKSHNELVTKYSDEENPNKVSPKKIKEFSVPMQALLDSTVQIDIEQRPLVFFRGLKIKPLELDLINFLFTDLE